MIADGLRRLGDYYVVGDCGDEGHFGGCCCAVLTPDEAVALAREILEDVAVSFPGAVR